MISFFLYIICRIFDMDRVKMELTFCVVSVDYVIRKKNRKLIICFDDLKMSIIIRFFFRIQVMIFVHKFIYISNHVQNHIFSFENLHTKSRYLANLTADCATQSNRQTMTSSRELNGPTTSNWSGQSSLSASWLDWTMTVAETLQRCLAQKGMLGRSIENAGKLWWCF